ncbi:isochorismatase family protein [Lichenifustis flavocetrariae]|uniref:Isochorismatase family protein n=1 Tax=Lichenifustis flavocetrariae TaxID=2949735 RepID=A0AA41YXE9_9HYPH|nr:isochorismatase family protein [Lichenifustis flavocetrariae]MCW6506610.1 isochorismatase family protein [Lichenifustis flavocetrariae]
MIRSDMTAREMYRELRSRDTPRFGFGAKAAIVNVDPQNAYTRPDEFVTAYETDPRQMEHISRISDLARARNWPVVWTYVAYLPSGEDCGIWGTRTNTEDSLQNIRHGSRRAMLDDRLNIDRARDVIINKRMASAFHDTMLGSLLTFHRVDTVIVTGGSTSGCVRATVVDSLSRGYRTIVPEECVSDVHESPHYANLYDMHLKYADVVPVADVVAYLSA